MLISAVFEELLPGIRPGVTELEVAAETRIRNEAEGGQRRLVRDHRGRPGHARPGRMRGPRPIRSGKASWSSSTRVLYSAVIAVI